MLRKRIFAGISGTALLSAGCTYLPALQEATGGIPVRDIVLRVKCELSDAFENGRRNWLIDEPKFAWLRNWTAQVDMTLQILDTATLSPGLSATQPFHNAYATTAGPTSISTSGVPGTSIASIPQSFVVTAGVNLGGQAERTETIGFALSLKELHEWRQHSDTAKLCALSDGMDLRGRLGLKEWILEALTPVASEGNPELPEYLWGGVHPKPNATPPSPVTAAIATPPGATPKAGHAAPTPCDSRQTIETQVTQLLEFIKKDSTFANALGVVRTATQNATTAAKDVATNLTTANTLTTNLKKLVTQYKTANGAYAGVLDPSLSRELAAEAKDWSKTIQVAKSMLDAIEAEAKSASLITEINNRGNKVTNVPAVANSLAASLVRLPLMPTRDEVDKFCKQIEDVQDTINNAPDTAAFVQYQATQLTNYAQASDGNLNSYTGYVNTLSSDISALPNIDPPISTIGQSVQFILNYSGNITPTWTFARFAGSTNPLFSAGGARTHMLNITLGPTSPGTFNTPSQGVTENQLYLLLNNLFPPSRP